jgi:hypothetical protein
VASGRACLLAHLLLLTGATAAPAADVASYRFTRTLDVPAAGPVRVPLDLQVLRHFGATPLAVFAPDGAEVASRLESDEPSCCRVSADLIEARQDGDVWHVVLDLGATPPLHEQLQFRILRLTSAPAVRLEGSGDRTAWRLLAEGDLFRLGWSASLEHTALTYPPNRHRYLRLTWPASAGTPELREVLVTGSIGRSLTVRGESAACRREGAAAVCTLPLPGALPPGLRLHLRLVPASATGGASGERVGYRISRPFVGQWATLAEGTAAARGEVAEVAVPLPATSLPGEPLRLELYGGAAPPRLAGWALEVAQPSVAFYAPRAGRYTLAYGGGEAPPREADGARREETSGTAGAPAPGEPDATAWVVPGPERAQELPPLPATAVAPGAPLGDTAFAHFWPVRAPRVRAGEIVRLDLPASVVDASGPDLPDVRLAVGERQLPYVHLSPETPALVAARRGLRPRPERRGGKSSVTLKVEPQQWVETASLTATPPFRRWLTVSTPFALTPGLNRVPGLGDAWDREEGFWDCYSSPPLFCRREVDLPGLLTDRVIIRFDDRDNPPIPAVDVAVWRRRQVLVFVWPAAGEVRLLAGASDLAAPRYDLELLAPQLLARPWRPARVDVGGGGPAAREAPWQPWLLPAALAVAGAGLLLLLGRLLATRS